MESREEVFYTRDTEFLPDKYAEDTTLRSIVIQEIEELPKNQRLCIVYHYLYEMKGLEIAEVMELTPWQVSIGMDYARQALKKRLEERFGICLVYAVAPVSGLPALTRVLQTYLEVFVSQQLCEQIVQNVMAYLQEKNRPLY